MSRTKRSVRREAHREHTAARRPPWFARLRVMAEYGSSGIWVVGQVGPFRHAMIEHSALRLPAELAEGFRRWIAAYEDRLDAPDDFDTGAFNHEGRELARAVKAFVGPTTAVEFVPETPEGALAPAEEVP